MTDARGTGDRAAVVRRARRLEIATIAWNVMEVFVTVGLGVAAGSLALIAFGFDSVAEIAASAAVLWDLRGERERRRTRRALRVVALAFFALAAVLLVGGVRNLAMGHRPDVSPAGIAFLGVTACVMFGLAVAKHRASREAGSHTLVHETRVTFLDGMLAGGVLLALVANAAFAWWWADSVAAITVALVAIAEGLAAPREHTDGDDRAVRLS